MSFSASPSDIIIVVTFCRELYRKCRSAGGEYDEISREVRGLHTVLKHLKSEIEYEDSPLNRDQSIWGRQLAPIIGDCDFTLRQLDDLLLKYERLFVGNGSANGGSGVLWDRMGFGSNEMDQLGGIRVKLISHKTSLILFLDTIQLYENEKMADSLDVQGEQLDTILDKVDHIAGKMSQRAGTLMKRYEDDDEDVWKQFRRELTSEGFSSDVLQQHEDVLRAYIRQIEQDGLLVEEPPIPQMSRPVSPHTERWVDSTHSEPSHENPPFADSVNTGSDYSEAKEMMQREENIKFPISMKLEKPKDESHLDPQLERQPERQSNPISRQLSPPLTSKISTTNFAEPKWQKDISGFASASDASSINRTGSPSNTLIIQTSDLLPFPATPHLLPPPSSSSYHSHPDEAVRSIALRPKRSSDQASSPRISGVRFDLPGHPPSPRVGTGISARSDSAMPLMRLAPDSRGNEISPDANWTKVKRSLISPEVLIQDGRRFEARPEFVAILGILTKEEIQDYASRSHILREERWRKHYLAPVGPEQRSGRERTSRTRRRRISSASESSSSSSDTTSDSHLGSNGDKRRGKRGRQDEKNKRRHDREYQRGDQNATRDREERSERRERTERKKRDRGPSYTCSSASAPYPHPPSQPFSTSPQLGSNNTPRPWNIPGSDQFQQGYLLPPQKCYPQQAPYPIQNQQYSQSSPYPPPQQGYLPSHQYLSLQPYPSHSPSSSPSNKLRNPDYHPHRRRHQHSHHSRDRDRDRDRDLGYSDSHKYRGGGSSMLGKAPTTGSRWRDHLTAAGLGGAAVGLLNALSEAADGF